jgi:ABC-type glycerol-3-phosphate transport system permease component
MSRRGSEGRSESRAYKIVMYTILITGAIPIILPFYWLVAASLKTKERVNAYPPDWLPIVPADYLKVGGQELRVRIFDDGRGSGTFVARVRALPEHGHLDLPRAAIRRTTADAVFAAVDGRQRRVELRGAPASGGDGVTVALLGQLREVSVPADELESREETETYWTVLGRELRVTPAELPHRPVQIGRAHV